MAAMEGNRGLVAETASGDIVMDGVTSWSGATWEARARAVDRREAGCSSTVDYHRYRR
jgi:hypothetical protein